MLSFCPNCGGEIGGTVDVVWRPTAILRAAQDWAERCGEQPTADDWRCGAPDHPAQSQVVNVFGSWGAMIAAAGYAPKGRGAVTWTRERTIEAFLDWVAAHGRWPASREWDTANASHPHRNTVIRLFGAWDAARRAAGYTGAARAKVRSRKRALRPLVRAVA